MNKKKLTKKGYLAIIISSSILIVLSLVLITICAVIAKHIEYKYFEAIAAVVFIAMIVIALVLLLSNYKRIIDFYSTVCYNRRNKFIQLKENAYVQI